MYGTTANVAREWSVTEETRWDDESLRNGSPWATSNLMVNRTTTDQALDAVAVANLAVKYGGGAGLNEAWRWKFPPPTKPAVGRGQWQPLLRLLAETRTLAQVSARALTGRS